LDFVFKWLFVLSFFSANREAKFREKFAEFAHASPDCVNTVFFEQTEE